jgi:hypothetical protein
MAKLKPLNKWSEEEIDEAWAREEQPGQSFGLPMLQDEISRRAMEKVENASRSVEEATRTLNGRLLWLTAALALVALVQLGLAIPPDVGILSHDQPAFSNTTQPSVDCPDRSGSLHNGPCTVSGIFHNNGGVGTEIATFEVTGTANRCQAVIPSASRGDDAQASCVIDGPVVVGSTVAVTSINR